MRIALALALAVAACTDTPPLFGPPTESACPPGGTTLTYENVRQAVHGGLLHALSRQQAARRGPPGRAVVP